MIYVRWFFTLLILCVVGAVLHYSLPSRDIVRILNTEVVRQDFVAQDAAGNEVTRTRDVRQINAASSSGEPRVYRNEDTDWGFPWYLKFDSANLAAEAENLASTEADPRWVVITHYGWRVTYFSWFPNAISVRRAEGPDETLIPWFNIILISLLMLGVLIVRRIIVIAVNRHVDPLVDEIEDEMGLRANAIARAWRGIRSRVAGLFN